MTAPNHIVGGFTFTGVFASIAGINILQDYRLLPILFFATLLPDIDHTKSLIGKLFFPIAKAINRRYGHRTITHSIFTWIVLTGLISTFQGAYFPSIKAAQVFGLAYGSHLLFDMMTVQGVPLFYPFKKNPCVIPGNPHLRMRTSNIRQETLALCVFMMCAIFMKPLFANGFWTSYNRLFGTLAHLVSEYNKSENLMIVDFTTQRGSEIIERSGLCVRADEFGLTIITKKKKFETYYIEGQLLRDFYPTMTKMKYQFVKEEFTEISLDSLRRLFANGKYSLMEFQGSRSFLFTENNLEKTKKAVKIKYPNKLIINKIDKKITVQYDTNPSIKSKKDEIKMYRTLHKKAQTEYQSKLNHFISVEKQIDQEKDEIKKELLMIEFSNMKHPTPPDPIDQKISRIEADIRELQANDRQKHKNALRDAQTAPLTFSGSYEKLQINGKDL